MKKIFLLALTLPVLMGACSNVKKNLGLERNQPDEFTIVERAPLTIPPNFNLMPPRPGETLKDTGPSVTAEGLILGSKAGSATTNSVAEDVVLSGANSVSNKPVSDIAEDDAKEESVSDKLGLSSSKKGTAINPTDEANRLKNQNIKTSPVMKNAR